MASYPMIVDERLLAWFNANVPAHQDEVAKLESTLEVRLPSDYVAFLRRFNGGEGLIGMACLILWRAQELLDLKQRLRSQ